MNITYQSGQWYALVNERAIVVLAPDATIEAIEGVWASLQEEVTLGSVVDGLTRGHGGSFAQIPPFAALVREGENARLAVRGQIVAHVSSLRGTESFTGAEVTTWSERFVSGVTGVEIVLDEDEADGPGLPIDGGAVRVSRIVGGLRTTEAPSAGSVIEPAPNREQAAEEPADERPAFAAVADAAPAQDGDDVEATVLTASGITGAAAAAPTHDDTAADELEPVLDSIPVLIALPPIPVEDASIDTLNPDAPSGLDADPVSAETLLPAEMTFAERPVEIVAEDDSAVAQTIHRPPVAEGQARVTTDDALGALINGGDHDGATISLAQARALREARAAATAGDDAPPPPVPPLPPVPPVPERIDGAADAVASGARIRVSTGQVVPLDRTVIIGRRPRSTRSTGDTLPHLIAVDSPQQDISRSHLEIRPESGAIVVVDLHTTNGSVLLRPGSEPMRLHPGEQTVVISGDTIDLGDDVTVLFEDLP